ncbi:MAG: hypothetical protein JSS75_07565 [Bacteroidetes bacterium]|nr:hypothetical protein [Bacteroidota bacterium]
MANTQLTAVSGVFKRSTSFLQSSWTNSPFAYTGNALCLSLHTDDVLTVNNAQQWMFSHKMVNNSATLAPPMRKVAYIRGGKQWLNGLEIDFGASPYSDLQLAIRDNAGVAGDFLDSASGSIPIASFPGTFTAVQMLNITTHDFFGRVSMGLVARNNDTGLYSMFEMELVIVH